LERGLFDLGLAETGGGDGIEALLGLASRLDQWAARLNLTGHRKLEDVILELVLEAAALHVALPPGASIADIGSGAGFPGLPLAVLRPATEVTLIESRERRHHFQRFVIRELRLANVVALRGRAEALAPNPHALALAQAAAQPALVLPWLLRWLEPGGVAAIPGGVAPPSVPPHAHVRGTRVVAYTVPVTRKQRTLWLGHYEP
jgi:16S rRNA (guanine527-N7)-methyltransferase